MPPRPVVAALLVFWLAANGWLFYREVWPFWRTGDPPPYTVDLTEELGNPSVNWEILKNGKKIGYATSHVQRRRDRTYDLQMQFIFDELRIVLLHVRKLTGDYHISEDGDLLGMTAHAWVGTSSQRTGDLEMHMEVRVENGELIPELFFANEKLPLGDIRVPMQEHAGAINPLHPLHRLPGLHKGRRWRITLLDPTSAIGKALGGPVQGLTIPELHAEVKTDTLLWHEEDVPCFKIEYRKTGEPEPVAFTWVRRRDGLVLQQHSSNGLAQMTLVRKPAN